MTVDEMLAREAIRYTMAVYNNCGDRGRIDEMMDCFTEDAVLDVTPDHARGRAAIAAFFKGVMDTGRLGSIPGSPARHHLATSRIEFEGADAAQGWTYFQLVRDGTTIQTGLYLDRFVRFGDRWLLAHRRVKVEHDTLPPQDV